MKVRLQKGLLTAALAAVFAGAAIEAPAQQRYPAAILAYADIVLYNGQVVTAEDLERPVWQRIVQASSSERIQFLIRSGALEEQRIYGVETGGCPHTAIREDASINLDAVDRMIAKFGNLDVVFIESGGDNLSATFSPELSDLTLYVIDVSAGDKIPRKGGPGITKSDLLVINKTDLAPHVGASLEVMDRDAKKMRGERPFVFTNLKTGAGLSDVVTFIERHGVLG